MLLSRRFLVAGLMATAATGACAKAPDRSPRPPDRPLKGVAPSAPDAERLIADANLGGAQVSYLVADAATGTLLEGRNTRSLMAPASTAKTLTTLYAFDRLGQDYRFATRLYAAGPIEGGVLNGDLVLVGGGDPSLDTDALAGLVAQLKGRGVRSVSGRLLYWAGALPYEREIVDDQPPEVGYNPGLSGLNLNFNRVYFGWTRTKAGYSVSMDARSASAVPQVDVARMAIVDRGAPVYTYRDGDGAEQWTVARSALGRSGGRWLPVRHPGDYTANVFQALAAAQGIAIRGRAAISAPPQGQPLAVHMSAPLRDVAREMLKYSTNMTAEVLGLTASGQRSLTASAAAMDAYMAQKYAAPVKMQDHSGLDAASRVTAENMVSVLVGAGPQGPLLPLLKPVGMKDRHGGYPYGPAMDVHAKTGTLNFVSCLCGYARGEGGRMLAFSMMMGDLRRRSGAEDDDVERPPGARSWNLRAKKLQLQLLGRWGTVYMA